MAQRQTAVRGAAATAEHVVEGDEVQVAAAEEASAAAIEPVFDGAHDRFAFLDAAAMVIAANDDNTNGAGSACTAPPTSNNAPPGPGYWKLMGGHWFGTSPAVPDPLWDAMVAEDEAAGVYYPPPRPEPPTVYVPEPSMIAFFSSFYFRLLNFLCM